MKGGEGMKFGIDKFSGIWVSNDLLRVEIVNVDETSAVVSLYAQGGISMKMPFLRMRQQSICQRDMMTILASVSSICGKIPRGLNSIFSMKNGTIETNSGESLLFRR